MSAQHLRIQRKPFEALSASERSGWAHLLNQSKSSRWAFLSLTYAEAVNETLGPVDVLLCWRADELVGVMPLQRATGWLGRLGMREPVGRHMTDYFGLLARPGVKLDWAELLRAARVPCLYFTHLDESQAAHGLTGDSPRKGLRTRIHPDGGDAHWEWLRTQDKKLVSDTERRERKLVAEHGVIRFEMQSSTPDQDLDCLVALKNAQYQRTGHDGGALLDPANARLLAYLVKAADPDCQPLLSVLHCGAQWVAGHFGLQCGPLLHYWFPVYDSRYSAYSPGRILYRHILLGAQARGIECIDRGEGDSAAKRDFGNEEHHFFKGLYSAGSIGSALNIGVRINWRIQSGRKAQPITEGK
ncbi:GNAT family N-acetyltransferase [Hydrogenophaga sp.]|uniref:GNAT family N-acetyltransferase n=1 Tax=Hydrogenophaga sp. TaxID=1904254 RepID=UPI00391AAFA6